MEKIIILTYEYLDDLRERMRRRLGHESQAEGTVKLSDGGGQGERKRRVGSARRRRVLRHGQELPGTVQHGRQRLERAHADLRNTDRV